MHYTKPTIVRFQIKRQILKLMLNLVHDYFPNIKTTSTQNALLVYKQSQLLNIVDEKKTDEDDLLHHI